MKNPIFLSACCLAGCLIMAGAPGAQYEAAKNKRGSVEKFPWPRGIRGAVSLTFDDARLSQIDTLIPILDRAGVKGTFYLSMNNLTQRLEGWKKAVRNGHEIGNHTLTHPCTGNYPAFRWNALEEMTLDGLAREIDGAQAAIAQADAGDVKEAIQRLTAFLATPEVAAATDPEIQAARRRIKELLHDLEDRGFDQMSLKHMVYSSRAWTRRGAGSAI